MNYKQDVLDKTDLTREQVDHIFAVGVDKHHFTDKTIHEICLKGIPAPFESYREDLIVQTIELYCIYNKDRREAVNIVDDEAGN